MPSTTFNRHQDGFLDTIHTYIHTYKQYVFTETKWLLFSSGI